MASQIEGLTDRAGNLKFASGAAWNSVRFPYYKVASTTAACEEAARQ